MWHPKNFRSQSKQALTTGSPRNEQTNKPRFSWTVPVAVCRLVRARVRRMRLLWLGCVRACVRAAVSGPLSSRPRRPTHETTAGSENMVNSVRSPPPNLLHVEIVRSTWPMPRRDHMFGRKYHVLHDEWVSMHAAWCMLSSLLSVSELRIPDANHALYVLQPAPLVLI